MKTKTIQIAGGSLQMDKTTHVYQLNKSTGNVTRAETIETGHRIEKVIEFDGCMYLPAQSLEIAQATFATIFKAAKDGKIKLSWREKVAKWLTVIQIKWNRLWVKFK